MRIDIKKSIAGLGDIVSGSRNQFHLDAGMTVDVEDATALKWVASGIASIPVPETASLAIPETAAMQRPVAKRRK